MESLPLHRTVLVHFGFQSSYYQRISLAIRQTGYARGSLIFPPLPGEFLATLKSSDLQRFDGIATVVVSREREAALLRSGLACVNFGDALPTNRILTVCTDGRAIGEMAAEHFLALGFRHFAYWGDWSAAYSVDQRDGLRDRVLAENSTHDFFEAPRYPKPWNITPEALRLVRRWLESCPKPLAVMGGMDLYASVVTEMALDAGLRVPDDVAVMGVSNDDFYAHFGHVPLSSIAQPAEAVGREVALLLERMLGGEKIGAERILLPPLGIISRKSTDVLHADDPLLAAALRFIRDHIQESVSVEDVANRLGYSRRTVQNLFREKLGRTVLQEIWRQRLLLIEDLLINTSLTTAAIAERVGLSSAQRLSVAFQQHAGISPSAFRILRRQNT